MVWDNITDVIKALEEIGGNLVNWFLNNEIKVNTDKCNLILNRQEPNTLKIEDLHTNNTLSEKLLSITFDCKLKFNKHMDNICQKARLAPYIRATKSRMCFSSHDSIIAH